MIDISNIHLHSIPPPQNGTVFGSAASFDALPETHKAQILFLDKTAEKYLYEFVENARMLSNGGWAPFEKGIFKTVEQYEHAVDLQENIPLLKKWLYNKGIPFGNWVFVLCDSNEQPLLMSWKMLIKYAYDIFLIGDTLLFDPSRNWCVFNYHEGQLFFAKDNIYDPSAMELYLQELNERKKKYPQFKHPYL
ncbi:hypothetical protein [Lacibacter sediminis]|uniref:Uncharacterized protein n=1 Tax=Lacibacter sediminis TaxID=2760713 RepID=A0A7G5XM91_9BACT|nr:hypothetical protein [Lacibacter sediminis]QNA46594.1 hypothetical protein H4075_10620 [Lacibacter sediminis]